MFVDGWMDGCTEGQQEEEACTGYRYWPAAPYGQLQVSPAWTMLGTSQRTQFCMFLWSTEPLPNPRQPTSCMTLMGGHIAAVLPKHSRKRIIPLPPWAHWVFTILCLACPVLLCSLQCKCTAGPLLCI